MRPVSKNEVLGSQNPSPLLRDALNEQILGFARGSIVTDLPSSTRAPLFGPRG